MFSFPFTKTTTKKYNNNKHTNDYKAQRAFATTYTSVSSAVEVAVRSNIMHVIESCATNTLASYNCRVEQKNKRKRDCCMLAAELVLARWPTKFAKYKKRERY